MDARGNNFSNATRSQDGMISTSHAYLIAITIFESVCLISGTLGNVYVIVYNVCLNKNKSPTSHLVINLAFTDIVACLTFFLPWIYKYSEMLAGLHKIRAAFCMVTISSVFISVSVSTMTLAAITLDRYIYIKAPFKYVRIMTRKVTACLLSAIWLAVLAYVPVLLSADQTYNQFCRNESKSDILFGATIYLVLPLIAIFSINYRIFRVARWHRRRIDRTPGGASDSGTLTRRQLLRELKVIKTFAIIVGTLLLCYTPFCLLVAARTLGYCVSCLQWEWSVIVMDMVAMNSVLNPFIYSMRQREYRNGLRQLFSTIRALCL